MQDEIDFLFLPCLKRHGSIEARLAGADLEQERALLPCLKRHGSIEAIKEIYGAVGDQPLTMSEKTWLH